MLLGMGISTPSLAQMEPGLYFMPEVFQSAQLNPAYQASRKVVVSLPSAGLTFANSNIPFQALFVGPNAGQYDIGPLINQMPQINYARSWGDFQTFGLGIRFKNIQIGIDHRLREQVYFNYSKDIAELFWFGNGSRIGETLQLSPDFQATLFHEVGARVSVGLGKRIKAGLRIKLLGGIADARSARSDLSFYTDPAYYQLTLNADYQVQMAYPEVENFDPATALSDPANLPLFANQGIGADLGIEAKITKRLRLSASLLDLGSINWTTNASSFTSQGAFTFSGFPLSGLADSTGVKIPAFADTLQTLFYPQQTSETYQSNLAPRLLIGAQWDPIRFVRLGALYEQEWIAGQSFSSFGVHAGLHWRDIVYLGANYTHQPLYEPQVGAQLMVRVGPIQTYLMANQLLTINRYWEGKTANIRFGMSLSLGKVKTDRQLEKEAKKKEKQARQKQDKAREKAEKELQKANEKAAKEASNN